MTSPSLNWWPIRRDLLAAMDNGLLLLAESITEHGEQAWRWQVTAPRISPIYGFAAKLEDAQSDAENAARAYAG